MKLNNNQQAFLALVRAGLWEKDVLLAQYEPFDIKVVYCLAQEQAVVGIVAAGIEHVTDVKLPKEDILLFVGETLQLEQRNREMNTFIGSLVEKMREADIYSLLVKGQGIAQCYERPLWRACGDVDFLLSNDNYSKAIAFLEPLASRIGEENKKRQHHSFTIESWEVELHGTLRIGLWGSIEKTLDDVHRSVFYGGNVRSWMNGFTQIFLPSPDEDVVFVFSHILQHFYKEGIGLRQTGDWCRLLWTYRETIDKKLLQTRLKKMGIMSEWKAFVSLAVYYLGMPVEALPFYSANRKWSRKADKIMDFILETGNFGHNRDLSYMQKEPFVIRKLISLWRHTADGIKYLFIFPLDSLKVWIVKIRMGLLSVIQYE